MTGKHIRNVLVEKKDLRQQYTAAKRKAERESESEEGRSTEWKRDRQGDREERRRQRDRGQCKKTQRRMNEGREECR